MELNGWPQVFIGGALGPVAVELAKLAQMRRGRMSTLYGRWLYWLLTIPLLLLGGLAAIAHGTAHVSLWTAMQLGATAPLLFAALASGRKREASLMPELERPSGWNLLRW